MLFIVCCRYTSIASVHACFFNHVLAHRKREKEKQMTILGLLLIFSLLFEDSKIKLLGFCRENSVYQFSFPLLFLYHVTFLRETCIKYLKKTNNYAAGDISAKGLICNMKQHNFFFLCI